MIPVEYLQKNLKNYKIKSFLGLWAKYSSHSEQKIIGMIVKCQMCMLRVEKII